MNKAASTSATFGVELDDLLGHVVAIGEQTRESGNILGNSLKTIYARITTNQSAISALEEIGISMNKIDGEAKNSAELIEELAGRWDSLSDAERRNTAVGVAGIYQLSRFNALMNNYSTAIEASTTATNSYNSAAREQEKYNQSLEARINRLNTAWYDLSNTLGQTVIYDAIIFGTSALETMTKVGGTAGGSLVMLAGTIGTLGGVVSLFSTRFNRMTGDILTSVAADKLKTVSTNTLTGKTLMLVAGINAETAAEIRNTAATNANTVAKTGATVATTALATALRGLLAATGVGLVLMGIGLAAGVIINKFSEAKQEAEELESYMNKNTSALTDNKEEVDKLIASLESLRKNKSRSIEEEQEYVNVQNRLAELYPSLVQSVDANGNAHIKSSEAITKEIEVTKELIQLERELKRTQARDTFKDNNKELSSLENKIKNAQNMLKYLGKHDAGNNEAIAKWKLELLQLETQYADSSKEIQYNIMEIANSWIDVGDEVESVIKNQIQESIDSLDFSGLSEDELADFSKKLSTIMQDINNAFKNDDSSAFDSTNKSLGALFVAFGLAKKGSNGLSVSFDDLKKSSNVSGEIDALNETLDEHGNVVDKATQEHKEFIEALDDLKSNISYINKVLEDYNETGKISSETMLELIGKYPSLLQYINDEGKLIKELTRLRDEDVKTAQQQLAKKIDDSAEFYVDNLKLIEDYFKEHFKFYKGDLEDFKNLAEAKKAVETELIKKLAEQWKVYYSSITGDFMPAISEWTQSKNSFWIPGQERSKQEIEASERAKKANEEYQKVLNSLNNFSLSQINLDFSKIGTSLDKVSSSTSSANKATSESIYITDEYKLAMDALNSAIAKQNALRDDFSDHSDNYRKALQAEIDLLEQQIKLQKEQANSLRNQISSGKIKQTGAVSVPTASTTTTTSSTSRQLSGWNGTITSTYGAKESFRKSPHTGIDIASKKGTRLDSNVNGKVASTGYNNVSGNYVVVMDNNGYRHFYGHLDSIAVAINDVVKMGDKIGAIGNTGNVVAGKGGDGSHLHYEIKYNGKNINPIDFVNSSKGVKNVSSTTTSTIQSTSQGVVDTGQQAIDDAQSALHALEESIVSNQEKLDDLYEDYGQSIYRDFDYRKGVFDDMYNRESSNMRNADKWSKKYNDTLWRQIKFLEDKQAIQLEEKAYIEQQLHSGKLTERKIDELTVRYGELLVAIQELDSNIWEHQIKKMDKFVSEAERATNVIEYMSKMTETLSKGTERYGKALDDISEQLRIKKQANEAELKGLMELVAQNKITGESLEGVISRIQQLRIQIQDLANDIQQNNFDIIMNIKVASDERIDDLDYELQKSQIFQDSYVEGSALWNKEIDNQLKIQKQIMEHHDKTRRELQKELLDKELTAERIKEIYEAIEDESLAYLNASKAIQNLQKQLEDAKKNKLKEIADQIIDSIKDAISEVRDEHLDDIDKIVDAETKAHEKRKKQMQDEMNLFRKNVEEKLKLIDLQEAERDYNMEMDELESERDKVQNQINLLMLDNSNEAKSKRKKLQEQLDKIDKDIAEKKHDRDITLQKEALQQNLEDKENEVGQREEIEDERHQNEIDRINREREYWQKYYEDRLNDEREFARIREQIMAGNFEAIQTELDKYAIRLESSMHKLEDTLGGTMEGVGTSIRQNVIDRLREALSMVDEFNKSQIIDPKTGLDGANDKVHTDPFNPNKGKEQAIKDSVGKNNDKEKLSQGDLKVLVAKYMREQMYYSATNEMDKWWIDKKSTDLAAEGRAEGSSAFPSTVGLKDILPSLSKEDLQRLSKYAKQLSTTYINNPNHQRHMQDWANKIASLDTGGLIKSSSFGGVDGKGGKMAILHNKEVVLDAVDTNNLIKNIKVSDGLAKTLHAMQNSMSKWINNLSPTLVGNGGYGDIHIQFGDVYGATQQQSSDFAKDIINKVRMKGGRI